jgi:C-terminal processing protease CtpA/Prc
VVALRQGDDRWSRAADKAKSDALSMEGKYVGTGMSMSRDDGERLRIAFAHADSPAGRAKLKRGDVIWSVGGKTVADRDAANDWADAWGGDEPGDAVTIEVHDGTIAEADVTQSDLRQIELVKDWVQIVTVPTHGVTEVGGHKVGYLLFWTFVDIAYDELDAAFADFSTAGVDTVVVDLRYNGGGLIAVARYLIDLLAGAKSHGQIAYTVNFNTHLSSEDGVQFIERKPYSVPAERILFLTTKSTLSASELVINSLTPWAEVELVGATTGGKPVGSRYFEFCEKLLQAITFRFTNADGNTDYFDGLPVACERADDLDHQLGDPEEAMFAAALGLVGGSACPAGAAPPAPPAHPVELGLDPASAPLFELHRSM